MDNMFEFHLGIFIKLQLRLLFGSILVQLHISVAYKYRIRKLTEFSDKRDGVPMSLSSLSSINFSTSKSSFLWAASSHLAAAIASLFLSISHCFSSFSFLSFSAACFMILAFLASSSWSHWASTRLSASCFASANSYSATVAAHCCTSLPRSSECSWFKPIKQPNFPWEMSALDFDKDHNYLLKNHPFVHTIAEWVKNQNDLLESWWGRLENDWMPWWHNPGPRTLSDRDIWMVK